MTVPSISSRILANPLIAIGSFQLRLSTIGAIAFAALGLITLALLWAKNRAQVATQPFRPVQQTQPPAPPAIQPPPQSTAPQPPAPSAAPIIPVTASASISSSSVPPPSTTTAPLPNIVLTVQPIPVPPPPLSTSAVQNTLPPLPASSTPSVVAPPSAQPNPTPVPVATTASPAATPSIDRTQVKVAEAPPKPPAQAAAVKPSNSSAITQKNIPKNLFGTPTPANIADIKELLPLLNSVLDSLRILEIQKRLENVHPLQFLIIIINHKELWEPMKSLEGTWIVLPKWKEKTQENFKKACFTSDYSVHVNQFRDAATQAFKLNASQSKELEQHALGKDATKLLDTFILRIPKELPATAAFIPQKQRPATLATAQSVPVPIASAASARAAPAIASIQKPSTAPAANHVSTAAGLVGIRTPKNEEGVKKLIHLWYKLMIDYQYETLTQTHQVLSELAKVHPLQILIVVAQDASLRPIAKSFEKRFIFTLWELEIKKSFDSGQFDNLSRHVGIFIKEVIPALKPTGEQTVALENYALEKQETLLLSKFIECIPEKPPAAPTKK